ncbi:G protein-coupled receptor rhodopsin-like [Trinorchestia longiramus]|nr:G protein-coupled receptor rhodopsin-like [Trinorchestia longiramus]
MSVADLILAVSGPIPFTIRDTNAFWVLSPAWCHLEGYVQETVLLVSVFSLTVISLDRMLGIVRPFHRHINIFCARIIICFIWFCSAVLAVPFAIYRKYTVREWADTEEILCKETDQMNVWWLVNNVVIILSPLIIITTCYTVILVKFRKYDREIGGPEHPGLRHIKKRVVKMMFIVVIVFVVCWSPLLVFTICKKYFLETNGSVEPDKEDSTFILTRGAGNRGFMWSTRTHPTSQVDTSRLSNQSQCSQDSLNNNRPSSRDVDRKALPSKKKTKKVWTTWTHYGSRKYPHSGRQFSYKIPKIPSTIIEASKESSERSVSYGRQETISKDYCKSLEGHTTALTGHTNTYAHASTNNSYEELSPADVSLCNGQITLFNGHIKPPNATSLH